MRETRAMRESPVARFLRAAGKLDQGEPLIATCSKCGFLGYCGRCCLRPRRSGARFWSATNARGALSTRYRRSRQGESWAN